MDRIRIILIILNKNHVKKKTKELGFKFVSFYRKGKRKDVRVIFKDENGYKYDILFSNLIRNKYKPCIIGRGNPFSTHNAKIWLKLNRNEFSIGKNEMVTNSTKKILFFHKLCRENFYNNWTSISGYKKVSCSICSGRQVGKYNNLKYINPELSKEWSSRNKILPYEIIAGSVKRIWWKCSTCKNEWVATVISRHQRNTGCPKCRIKYSKGEEKIKEFLKFRKIEYIFQKKFKNCKYKRELPFDFYLPSLNLCIEYHGEQHYKILRNNYLGNESVFKIRKIRDKIKGEYCKNNNIKLLVISYLEYDDINKILGDL